ncbi:MAG TPA: AMP-binding protein [Candidatus Binataceae bacterium]|nr:AMP-binding protein [Candidatus Binataceae bacterium]
MRTTLLDFFNDFADSPAESVIHDDGYRYWTYRYRQIAGAARSFAMRLRSEGIGKGDKVLFWSENRPEWPAAFWGCLLMGVVVVPIDYRTSAEVVRNVQNVVRARAVVIGDEVRGVGLGEAAPVWRFGDVDLSRTADPGPLPAIGPDDVVEIVFTSGSTAAPKGVVLTHRNLVADLVPIEREVLKYRRYARPLFPLRLLNLLPLSHMFGQALAMFFAPMVPAGAIFMRGYAPHEVVRQIESKRAAFLVAVPKMLQVLRQYVTREFPELAHLKQDRSPWLVRRWRYRRVHRLFGWKFVGLVVGGAPLEASLEEFWRALGFLVAQGYGLTETAPIVAFNHPFHLRPGTVGKPLPGVDLRIAPDGEILVRGDIVTPGYVGAPADASRAFENGWFHTADIGALDRDGYLTVRGRKNEMIVTPEGLKVFPDDVELVLGRIAGVRDCAVVGRERVHAVLVLDDGADKDEIIRRANAELEEHQKIRGVSIWTAGALPRTEGTGKLKRPAIQKWVDAGGVSAPAAAIGGAPGEILDVLRRYAPDRTITAETTLEELGLSSLEQVELMLELEEEFDVTLDERAFGGERRLGDLAAQLAQPTPSRAPAVAMRWNRGAVASAVRRIMLAGLILPLTRLCARATPGAGAALVGVAGPVIFAANHQSHLDTPVILSALPTRFRYATAPAMWMEFFDAHFHPERHPPLRRLLNSAAYYLAALLFNGFALSQQSAGLRETLRHIGDLVSEGWSVLIFPEGERTRSGAIGRFHPGVAMMASRLRVPVVPIRLRGVDRVLPRGAKIVRPGRVEIAFGAPIDLRGEDYEALSARVEAAVRAL